MYPDSTQEQDLMAGMPTADLGSCVAGLVNTLARGTAGLMAPHGLLPPDFALLRLFLGREEWTVTQLAQALPVKTSRISRVVANLVKMRLIRRRRLRNDRRVVFLTLTDEGKALTLDLHRQVLSYEAMLSQGVSEEEMAAFASVTTKVMSNYAAVESMEAMAGTGRARRDGVGTAPGING